MSTVYDWSPLMQGVQQGLGQYIQQKQYKDTLDALLGPSARPPIQAQGGGPSLIPRLLMHLGIGGGQQQQPTFGSGPMDNGTASLAPGVMRGADGTLTRNGQPADRYFPSYDNSGNQIGSQPGWLESTNPHPDLSAFSPTQNSGNISPRLVGGGFAPPNTYNEDQIRAQGNAKRSEGVNPDGSIPGLKVGSLDPTKAGDKWTSVSAQQDGLNLTFAIEDKPGDTDETRLARIRQGQYFGSPFETDQAAENFMRAQNARGAAPQGTPTGRGPQMGGISPQLAEILRKLPPQIGLPLLLQTLKPKEDEFASTRDGQIYNKRTGQLMGTSVAQRDAAEAAKINAQQADTIAGTNDTGNIGSLDSLPLDPGQREAIRSLVQTGGKQGIDTYRDVVKSLATQKDGGITTRNIDVGGEQKIGQFKDGNLVGYVKGPDGKDITAPRFKPDAPPDTTVLPGDVAIDPESNSILKQTGLSLPAYMALTGQASKLPRDKVSRDRAFAEAAAFANKQGVDVSTLTSQFTALNETLGANIKRVNNTKIMEGELQGTLENLKPIADAAGAGNLRVGNVAKLWAGQEFNDPMVQQYSFQLNQLRSELAAYNGALQGRTGASLTQQDYAEAERVIKNGLSSKGAAGLQTAVKSATEKMGDVMNRSVDSARKGVWDLFGVGEHYKPKYQPPSAPAPSPGGAVANLGKPDKDGWVTMPGGVRVREKR